MSELKLITSESLMQKVERLEREADGRPQVDCPITHHFAPGMYARELFIPADTSVTGAIHKTENLVVLASGTARIATEDGYKEVTGPAVMTCKPGAKNAVYAVTDVVWINFHATTETDLEKLAEQLTESKASELLGGPENKQLLASTEHQLEN